MPEKFADKTIFTLYEVNKSIQKTLSERYTSSFWVKAEMNKLNHYIHSGHCYPELVEKHNGKVTAQTKAILWGDDYQKINRRFLEMLGEPLKDGVKILFLARITFDPAHGLALRILDIDVSFTLGDLQKEKQESIERLKREGLFHKNKLLKVPLLPQRIALISVESSKGYADFIKVIGTNGWNYKFFHFLFPSVLQGEKAVEGIILQLQRIKKVLHHFDIVAIIRGGGGDVGLSCFNNYDLAKEIAVFPIPVFTGIGHATNETVVEMVAHSNGITPTKVAELLIQQFHNFSIPLQRAREKIVTLVDRALSEHRTGISSFGRYFKSVSQNLLATNKNNLLSYENRVEQGVSSNLKRNAERLSIISRSLSKDVDFYCFQAKSEISRQEFTLKNSSTALILKQQNRLMICDNSIKLLHPQNVLKRGYSITYKNGKALKSGEGLQPGDSIHTQLYSGKIISTIEEIKNT